MNFAQTSTQRFRVYEIDVDAGETCPFVFCNLDALYKAGYQQLPAAQYRMVYDGTVTYAAGQEQSAVLERIFISCNDNLPDGYQGHSLSVSDVVELYGDGERKYFYCETTGFVPVRFSPILAKPMRSDNGGA